MRLSVSSRSRLTDFNVVPQSIEKDKDSPSNAEKYEQNALEFNSAFVHANGESPKYNSQFEESNASNYFKFEQSHEQSSNVYVDRASYIGTTSQSDSSLTSQSIKEEATICQKSKETCSSGNNLVAKFKQDPELLAKFISNPNLVAKIFQDERVIMKIMTDPDMATCLATDPHITQFLKENGAIDSTNERDLDDEMVDRSGVPVSDDVVSPGSGGTVTRHTLKLKGSHVENPILTDLITNRNAEECKSQNLEPVTASADWNKNPADVTRDVVQDVQRYGVKISVLYSNCV